MHNGNHGAQTAELGRRLYLYVWRVTRSRQIAICVLSAILAPLMMLPLELQRRIVDDALPARDVWLLSALGVAYLGLILAQGSVKYWLNMTKGRAVEIIARDIRLRIWQRQGLSGAAGATEIEAGTVVSMAAAEAEDVSGFGGEAFSLPLLAGGTILYVAGYLLWVEPWIALLALLIYFPQALIVPLAQRTINRLARLRIREVRILGQVLAQPGGPRRGRVMIDRILSIRLMIYRRKYLLAALGNFLDSLGTVIVLVIGGYMVIMDRTTVGTLLVFISGLAKIADPWDQFVNYYRSVSNTAVIYDMIRANLDEPGSLAAESLGRREPA